MMNTIKAKIRGYGGVRKLHTIISQETIKPSSPTPHHLKTYNFSLLDHFAPNLHMPKVFFYKSYNDDNTKNLKQSLSKCLTQYYPFAGRFPSPSASYIDCNDEGIEFSEALIDSKIDDFVFNKNQDEKMDQLIPNGFGCIGGTTSPNNLLEVQLNHFTCGGVAIAVSISHKVADGFTAASLINHWASVASRQSPVNPKFILSPTSDHIIKIPEVMNKGTDKRNYVARKFIFPNSKLNELKKKLISMGTTPMNPSRVELLTSLIFKCSMGATITKSGCFKPSNLLHCVNMRNKVINICPNTAAGNIFTLMNAKIASTSKIMLAEVIYELKKGKMELDGLQSLQEVGKHYLSTLSMLEGDDESRTFVSTSLCRFPFYNVDFGWGKPIKVSTRYPDVDDNGVILLDTPSGDGIEALVHLEKEEMSIFEMDEELLACVEDERIS